MTDIISAEWKWYWHQENNEADCGVYAGTFPGHCYTYVVCQCPRYLKEEQWRAIATLICDEHNTQLKKAAA